VAAPPACIFSAARIAERVRALGDEVRGRFRSDPLTLLGVLKGSALFLADLARAVGEPLDLSFVHARSYGRAMVSGGRLALGAVDEEDVRDRVVVVADAILDTGRTLAGVVEAVRAAGAREIATCVLLDKPARRSVPIRADWVGFEVPDRFLVGYGLDHAGRFRALDYVGAIDG
jgi:hypoxanthine phosphoribosyltransferase